MVNHNQKNSFLKFKLDSCLAGLIFLYAFFFPTFTQSLDTQGAILVNGGLIILLSIYFLYKRKIFFLAKIEKKLFTLISITLFYYGVAIPISIMFLSQEFIFNDLFELHKPLLHFLSFIFSFQFINSQKKINFFKQIMMLIFCLVGILSLNQLFHINDNISLTYTKDYLVISSLQRLTVPFRNPYDYSTFLSFYLYYFIFCWINSKKFYFLPLMMVTFSGIAFSLSKTGLLTSMFSLLFTIPISLLIGYTKKTTHNNIKITGKLLYYLLPISIAIALFGYGYITYLSGDSPFTYIFQGFERALQGEDVGSVDNRFEQFNVTIDFLKSNPINLFFGNGVSKATMPGLESSYSYFLFRYGLLGFIVIFVIPLVISIYLLLKLIIRKNLQQKELIYTNLVWLFSLFIASFGSNVTEQYRLSFFYYFIVGLTIRIFGFSNMNNEDS